MLTNEQYKNRRVARVLFTRVANRVARKLNCTIKVSAQLKCLYPRPELELVVRMYPKDYPELSGGCMVHASTLFASPKWEEHVEEIMTHTYKMIFKG